MRKHNLVPSNAPRMEKMAAFIIQSRFRSFLKRKFGARRRYPTSVSDLAELQDTKGNIWEVPNEGKIMVSVDYERGTPDYSKATRHSIINFLRVTLDEPGVHESEKIGVLYTAAREFYFRCDQLQVLLDSALLKTNRTVKIEVLTKLLLRVVDTENVGGLCYKYLTTSEVRQLQRAMVDGWRIVVGNPSGHYIVDLSREMHRTILSRLIGVNNDETRARQGRVGQPDTSQHGNWSAFRNETLDDEPVVLGAAFWGNIPSIGILEFDFISSSRPPNAFQPLTEPKFLLVLQQVGGACGIIFDDGFACGRNMRGHMNLWL